MSQSTLRDRRRFWIVAMVLTLVLVTLGAVIRNQVRVYRHKQARAALVQQRGAFFKMLQPVALTNCEFKRFGELHDGGYLMCANLLRGVRSGYSYGISGYDKWGCDIATSLNVIVHQYDCFNTTRPVCPEGKTLFHEECVADASRIDDGRRFDTLANQIAGNGDRLNQIVLKIDVEGAEWDSFLAAPDEVLERIDQMVVEFHGVQDPKYARVVQRLKQFFEIAHVHFNNFSCAEGLRPFPTWAYEVLFVTKRLAVVDRSRPSAGPHVLDAPNNPSVRDCQARVE